MGLDRGSAMLVYTQTITLTKTLFPPEGPGCASHRTDTLDQYSTATAAFTAHKFPTNLHDQSNQLGRQRPSLKCQTWTRRAVKHRQNQHHQQHQSQPLNTRRFEQAAVTVVGPMQQQFQRRPNNCRTPDSARKAAYLAMRPTTRPRRKIMPALNWWVGQREKNA